MIQQDLNMLNTFFLTPSTIELIYGNKLSWYIFYFNFFIIWCRKSIMFVRQNKTNIRLIVILIFLCQFRFTHLLVTLVVNLNWTHHVNFLFLFIFSGTYQTDIFCQFQESIILIFTVSFYLGNIIWFILSYFIPIFIYNLIFCFLIIYFTD